MASLYSPKAHLCGHILAGEPFQQTGNIVLGLRQEKENQPEHDSDGQQTPVLENCRY